MEYIEYRVSGIWAALSSIFWLVASIFASFTVIMPLIGIILIIRAIIIYSRTRVTLDDGGVTLRQGLFTTQEKRFLISNIHAVSTSVGPIASQFDYGTIAIAVGNDKNEIKVGNLAGCNDLKQRIEERRSSTHAI